MGGGACSRSITDFATSAAERIVPTGSRARGFEVFLGADLGAALRRLGFGARTALLAAGVRTAGLGLRVAVGFGARTVAEATAATAFRRACFAAFFSILNNLRACLSVAFASRTRVLAAAARAAALVAASLSRFMMGDWVITRSLSGAARALKIDEYRRLPRRKRHEPWGTRAIRCYTPGP
jgi:hypothetical protein